MIKKINLFISLIVIVLLSGGCMSGMIADVVRGSIENTAIGGEFLIHDNPKVGDYAVYKSVYISYSEYAGKVSESYTENLIKYEVASVDDKEIVVKLITTPVFSESRSEGKVMFSTKKDEMIDRIGIPVTTYYLDKNGKIKNVLYKNEKLKIDTIFKIANPGNVGYIVYRTVNSGYEEIKTGAGTFKSTPVAYSVQNSTVLMGSAVRSINENLTFVSPKINFRKAASLTLMLTNPSTEMSRLKETLLRELIKKNSVAGNSFIIEDLTQNGATALKDIKTLNLEMLVEQGHS